MGTCGHCGNEYDKSFEIELSDGEMASLDAASQPWLVAAQ